jgi:hypothetical protein
MEKVQRSMNRRFKRGLMMPTGLLFFDKAKPPILV